MNFDALTRYLDRTAERGIPGCDLVVTLGHEVIYRHMSGEREPGKPMRGDEVYVLYSATKLFTIVAGMQLIERGAVRLDDPVSKYLPEYADLTVLDLEQNWTVDAKAFLSKGKNTPFDGKPLTGKVMATYVDGKCVYGEEAK